MAINELPKGMVLLFLLSAYGWGRLGRPFFDRRLNRIHALSSVLGLGLLNALGGALNLFGWASSRMLMVLLCIGVVVAGFELLKSRPWVNYCFSRQQAPIWAAVMLAGIAGYFLARTELFNFADDFFSYCVRVARMDQTGSVGGNPFDLLGVDGFGSQSFFQGFFLKGTDIRFLQGFDAVSCFALCLLVPAELAIRWRLSRLTGILAVVCVAFINPQQVNISPLYSGAVAIMTMVICAALLGRSLVTRQCANHWQVDISLALMAAWLVTLKVTLGIFGAFF